MQAVSTVHPQGFRAAVSAAARRPGACRRPVLLASRRHAATVARAGGEDKALGSIDQGPKKASASFQDMRNAQESYAEVPRGGQAGQARVAPAGEGSEKDAPESAPESGTLREAAYPLESKEGLSSEEEGPSGVAAPESGDVRASGPKSA